MQQKVAIVKELGGRLFERSDEYEGAGMFECLGD